MRGQYYRVLQLWTLGLCIIGLSSNLLANNAIFKIEQIKRAEESLYTMPSFASQVLCSLKQGAQATLLFQKDGWYIAKLEDDSIGWIRKEVLMPPPEVTPSIPEPENNQKQIRLIQVKAVPDGTEKILFLLNGFFPPKTFVIEEQNPRIVCDFPDTLAPENIDDQIDVNSKIIKKIRLGRHAGTHQKLRVVLDLMPGEYVIEQFFFKQELLYIVNCKPMD